MNSSNILPLVEILNFYLKRLIYSQIISGYMKGKISTLLAGIILYASFAQAHPLSMTVDKKHRNIEICSSIETLLNSPIIVGGINKDYRTGKYRNFNTPTGDFYVTALFRNPTWYPPSWAKKKTPSKTVYGPWMMILQKEPNHVTYDNNKLTIPYDSMIRLHSTDKLYLFEPKHFKNASSHGCIRLPPDKISELSELIISMSSKYKGPFNTWRGEIYILNDAIKVEIND